MAHTDKLADLPDEVWANHIMWKLALAMGIAKHDDAFIYVDPDDLLDAAVIRLGSSQTSSWGHLTGVSHCGMIGDSTAKPLIRPRHTP